MLLLTIPRAVRQQDQPEVRMYNNIALAFQLSSYPPSIRQRQFALTGETAENGNAVLRCFVRFINNDDAAKLDSAQKRGVGVLDNATFEGGVEHELVDGRVAMELDVLLRPSHELKEMSEV